jgi:hypothetical protein
VFYDGCVMGIFVTSTCLVSEFEEDFLSVLLCFCVVNGVCFFLLF